MYSEEDLVRAACLLKARMGLFVENFVLVLLGVGSYLGRCPRTHHLLNFIPIISIQLGSYKKCYENFIKITFYIPSVFLICPATFLWFNKWPTFTLRFECASVISGACTSIRRSFIEMVFDLFLLLLNDVAYLDLLFASLLSWSKLWFSLLLPLLEWQNILNIHLLGIQWEGLGTIFHCCLIKLLKVRGLNHHLRHVEHAWGSHQRLCVDRMEVLGDHGENKLRKHWVEWY